MKKIIFALLLAVVVITGGSLVYSFSNLFSSEPTADINEVKSFKGAGITAIDATADAGNITVGESPDDQVHVELRVLGISK